MLKPIAIFLILAAPPALAQDDGQAEIDDGISLLSEGARTLLEGLLDRVDPQMQGLADALRDWDATGLDLDGLRGFEAPEMLPNGDIIIRRKPADEIEPPSKGEIEL